MMDLFWKAVGCTLIAAVLYLVLAKKDKDIATVLSMAVCCMIAGLAASQLRQVFAFLDRLQSIAQLDSDMLRILMKSVTIGITAQIAEHVCADSGNSALGKTLQFLASVMILVLSMPLMESLLELIGKVLGGE